MTIEDLLEQRRGLLLSIETIDAQLRAHGLVHLERPSSLKPTLVEMVLAFVGTGERTVAEIAAGPLANKPRSAVSQLIYTMHTRRLLDRVSHGVYRRGSAA